MGAAMTRLQRLAEVVKNKPIGELLDFNLPNGVGFDSSVDLPAKRESYPFARNVPPHLDLSSTIAHFSISEAHLRIVI